MTQVADVAEMLYGVMAEAWVERGEVAPHVVAHGPFRVAMGLPSGECSDPVLWAGTAALGLGAVVGASVVGMGSEAWIKAYERGEAPEDLRRGELAALESQGDATIATTLTVVAADRLGAAAWLLGRCHQDDRGVRSVHRQHSDSSPSGRMIDHMRHAAAQLVRAPAPLLEPDLVEGAFTLACLATGTSGVLLAPERR